MELADGSELPTREILRARGAGLSDGLVRTADGWKIRVPAAPCLLAVTHPLYGVLLALVGGGMGPAIAAAIGRDRPRAPAQSRGRRLGAQRHQRRILLRAGEVSQRRHCTGS